MSLLEFCASFVGRDSVQKQWKVVLSLSWAGSSFLSFVALKEEGAAAEGAWVDGGPSVAGLLGSWENLPREDPRPPPPPPTMVPGQDPPRSAAPLGSSREPLTLDRAQVSTRPPHWGDAGWALSWEPLESVTPLPLAKRSWVGSGRPRPGPPQEN